MGRRGLVGMHAEGVLARQAILPAICFWVARRPHLALALAPSPSA
eukprot:CAMPEP_0177630948 /NCGR_PEP_ID=MMETSP0447-20121125/1488_1 /TAXON_ID=0 /ORGANISM="Stygamoeba regulata, Strain BSH-02190019" /LENGTH=44 /DNA_ID= /DNA_START= /DNA_END= /DNA_ORIENTATION=